MGPPLRRGSCLRRAPHSFGGRMFTLVVIIQIIVSIIMIIAVLLQSGKGSAIGSSFGGASSQTLFGSAGPQT
ncbi:MAG: preprotein translocase subunit SecG, partial [Deltaproteobacteria bacterium]